MCSSRVDPEHILNAFKNGADGVLIGGCHIGDCHYQSGNIQTLKRIKLLKMLIKDIGINEKDYDLSGFQRRKVKICESCK